MLLPFERAKKAASEKQASRYELPAKDGGVISSGSTGLLESSSSTGPKASWSPLWTRTT